MASVSEQIVGLAQMAPARLRAEWQRLHRNKPLPQGMSVDAVRRAIAWRIQEKAYGGFPPARLRELARLAKQLEVSGELDLERQRQLKPGTRLVRQWHGKPYTVTVLEQGYEFEERHYESLTPIARQITGAAWSGPRFFGLVVRLLVRTAELVSGTSLSRQDVRSMVDRVTVHTDRVEIALAPSLSSTAPIMIPVTLVSRSGEKRLFATDVEECQSRPDPPLVKLVVRASQARQLIEQDEAPSLADAATTLGVTPAYFGVLTRLSYLAPDIVAAIVDGRQPATLNRQRLARAANLPLDWQGQRELLGFT